MALTTDKLIPRLMQIPGELRAYRQWVAWRGVNEKGKFKKIPIDPATGQNASVANPETWGSFDEARAFYEESSIDGIGFVLSEADPYVVIDLDNCFDPKKNELEPYAWDFIKAQKSYSEKSPSGVGAHIWVRGKISRNIRGEGFEIYADKRFMTITGRRFSGPSGRNIIEGGEVLRKLWKKLVSKPLSGIADVPLPTKQSDLELDRMISAASQGPSRAKFDRLWKGNIDGYASASEADLALCRLLALNSGCRPELMDRMFRRSQLFREKWDSIRDQRGRTYGQLTISKARRWAMDELKEKWAIRSAADIAPDSAQPQKFLIDGLIPQRSLAIMVGHSNVGKSPLLYQAGLCIASGVSFLGLKTQQERVLYLDFENGTSQSVQLISKISSHIGLTKPPRNFFYWSLNSASAKWGEKGNDGLAMISSVRPGLVIIDSLTAFQPEVESRNSEATRVVLKLRKLIRETGVAVIVTHHLTKPSVKNRPESLQKAKPLQNWFFQARGAGAIINATDVRLGVEQPTQLGISVAESKEEFALIMRGFARVKGEIPSMYIARVFDADGEPIGYKKLVGPQLLFNTDQEAAYNKLPSAFRFKRALFAYGRGPQATSDFLKKCLATNIIKRTADAYAKI